MKAKLAWIGLMLGTAAGAATMRPSVIVYGDVRDSYGIRLNSGEQVSAYLGTNEVARTHTGAAADGMSYHLNLDVYDPATALPGQVQPSNQVQMRVVLGGVAQPTLGVSTFAAPGDGAPVKINLLFGVDSDGDGLPDAWEQLVMANSSGGQTNINQIGPGHDTDGDGMDDDEEFWYGSFAFLPGDQLMFTSVATESGRYRFRFLTVAGTSYLVEQAPTAQSQSWTVTPIALTPAGPLSPGEFPGNGNFMDIYTDVPASTNTFYRLRAK